MTTRILSKLMKQAACAAFFLFTTPAHAETPAGGFADLVGILAAMATVDVVILGEVHDNPGHHALQAQVLRGLNPSAVVFEMLTAGEAALITPTLASDPAALEAALDWSNSGWPDFEFYAPLFTMAANGSVFGAEVPRDQAQRAFAENAASVFGEGAARFGLDQPLPEDQQAMREAGQMAAHCDALPPEILPGFVEAQRLRDAVLAQAVLDAIEATGGPVAVIAGNGHARNDWGVPALLAIAAPDLRVISLGQVEDGDAPDDAPFDLLASAPPVERPDPCAAFR